MSQIRQDSTQSGDGKHIPPMGTKYGMAHDSGGSAKLNSGKWRCGVTVTYKCIGEGTLLEWWRGMGTKLRSMYMQS